MNYVKHTALILGGKSILAASGTIWAVQHALMFVNLAIRLLKQSHMPSSKRSAVLILHV